LKSNNVCIIIPVYNNPLTIVRVVEEVLTYGIPVIVVDDGSDIAIETLVLPREKLSILSHTHNQGKGVALRSGAQKALEMGFSHCLTMDGDGQHFAHDIPSFLAHFEVMEEPNTMII